PRPLPGRRRKASPRTCGRARCRNRRPGPAPAVTIRSAGRTRAGPKSCEHAPRRRRTRTPGSYRSRPGHPGPGLGPTAMDVRWHPACDLAYMTLLSAEELRSHLDPESGSLRELAPADRADVLACIQRTVEELADSISHIGQATADRRVSEPLAS